jgi:TrmH family RNA methyltransferase
MCSECTNYRVSNLYNHRLIRESQRDRLDVVLVSPRNPLNIGAVARAMANFGFSHLTVAAPYAPHWREARSAVGAPDLLQNARETNSLAEAVADCTFVAGTGTRRHRKPEQRVVSLSALAPIMEQQLARGGRIALVFGSEKHGLTREDLSFCHVLVEIPTDANQPSMNLGQAVAVCLYELASRGSFSGKEMTSDLAPSRPTPPPDEQLAAHLRLGAPSGILDRLAGLIEQSMTAAGYSPLSMQEANRHDLRLLLRRLAPSDHDARRILGLFRRILWRLGRSSSPRPPSR